MGFATGWNYEKIISDSVFKCASGCFEFGLCALFSGYAVSKCIKESIFSYLKNLILFCCGFLFYPITAINLFSLCFKSGVTARMLILNIKTCGFVGVFSVNFLFLVFTLLSGILSYFTAIFFISHRKRKQLDTLDFLLFKRIILCSLFILICLPVFVLLLSYTNIYGFFNSFL